MREGKDKRHWRSDKQQAITSIILDAQTGAVSAASYRSGALCLRTERKTNMGKVKTSLEKVTRKICGAYNSTSDPEIEYFLLPRGSSFIFHATGLGIHRH